MKKGKLTPFFALGMQSETKVPKNGKQTVFPSRQFSSTPVGLGEGFLKKKIPTILEHPQYFPIIAPNDSYLFSQLKSALKGRRFCGASDIIKNATEELKRLS